MDILLGQWPWVACYSRSWLGVTVRLLLHYSDLIQITLLCTSIEISQLWIAQSIDRHNIQTDIPWIDLGCQISISIHGLTTVCNPWIIVSLKPTIQGFDQLLAPFSGLDIEVADERSLKQEPQLHHLLRNTNLLEENHRRRTPRMESAAERICNANSGLQGSP